MDAFELLKNDHKKVSELFKEIESASGQAKTQLFSRIKNELDVHAHIEEKVFYPALENTEAAREITLEAYEEHKVVKDLLAELANGAPNDEWDAKLTVLKENVEHHVGKEEGELFSKARQALSREEIKRFGAEMEAEKARKLDGTPQEQRTPARATRQAEPAKGRSTKGSKQGNSSGFLQRIASLVGLGGSSSKTTKKRSTGRKAAVKKKSSGKTKSTKAKTKSATKKSGSKTTSASKTNTNKINKRQASARSRTSASKTAPRAGGPKKGKGRATTKRSRAK